MNTFIIIIGVSEYVDANICDLPNVKNDIERVKTIFTLLGNSTDKIVVFSDSEATKNQIINFFRRNRSKISEKDSLIVYFAGHGKTIIDSSGNKKNILCVNDTQFIDINETGVATDYLIESIYFGISPLKLTILIDACESDIVDLPTAVLKHIEDNEKSAFTLVSATKGTDAYSDGKGGIFTTNILKCIGKVSDKDTFTDLQILEELTKITKKEQESFSIHVGDSIDYSVSDLAFNYVEIKGKKYVQRLDSILQIYKNVLANDAYNHFTIVGKTQIGKSILAIEMESLFFNMVYVDVTRPISLEFIVQSIANKLIDKMKKSKRIPIEGYEYKYKDILEFIDRTDRTEHFILIDHAERLSTQEYDELISMISCSKYINILSFSRVRRGGRRIECPSFSDKEIDTLCKLYGDCGMYEREYYKDKPKELIKNSYSTDNNMGAIDTCIKTVCFTGGFISEEDFCKILNIQRSTLFRLIENGDIIPNDEFFVPHDSLYEVSKIDRKLAWDNDISLKYWKEQLILKPQNLPAAIKVYQYIQIKGTCWIGANTKKILSILSKSFLRVHKWGELEFLFPYLLENEMKKEIVQVSSGLANVARDKVFYLESDIDKYLSGEDLLSWKASYCEVLYWKGEFEKCKSESLEMMQKINCDSKLFSKVCLNVAIASFFKGEWDESKKYLNMMNSFQLRMQGWQKMILGTILAIRGEDYEAGIEGLNNSITILKKVKDDIGLGIAYCNIGECHVKKANYTLGKKYLCEGEKIARLTNDIATLMEIKRNQLQASILEKHAFDCESEQYADELEDMLAVIDDKTELMQVYNTLSVAYLYAYNLQSSKDNCEIAKKYTAENKEYKIYSLICELLICIVEEKKYEDILTMAIDLAMEGGNKYAIVQMNRMILDISDLYKIDIPQNITVERMKKCYGNINL